MAIEELWSPIFPDPALPAARAGPLEGVRELPMPVLYPGNLQIARSAALCYQSDTELPERGVRV